MSQCNKEREKHCIFLKTCLKWVLNQHARQWQLAVAIAKPHAQTIVPRLCLSESATSITEVGCYNNIDIDNIDIDNIDIDIISANIFL